MLVLNLPFKALMFLTLMRPSLVLFLVLWLKLVKDFLKVRCRLALLPFLISCLIWLDLVAAEGRKANDSHADCYQYFCVPEYGTANGRLHFHAVHFMRTLPTGSVDPNFGRRVRNRRQ